MTRLVDVGVQFVMAVVAAPDAALDPSLELQSPDELNLGWALLRTAVVLAGVILLADLTLNVGFRRLLGIKPSTTKGLVTVLDRVVLDAKRSLFVVKAGSEVLLLGGAEGSVTLLSKIDWLVLCYACLAFFTKYLDVSALCM